MRPSQWEPPIELSATEQGIVKRIRRAKLFTFLREHQHEVFDAAFQEELTSLYQESPHVQPPVAPALLGLAVGAGLSGHRGGTVQRPFAERLSEASDRGQHGSAAGRAHT